MAYGCKRLIVNALNVTLDFWSFPLGNLVAPPFGKNPGEASGQVGNLITYHHVSTGVWSKGAIFRIIKVGAIFYVDEIVNQSYFVAIR
jgi:hypothetical protein